MAHPMTLDQQKIYEYALHFAKRHGFSSWAPHGITPGEDRVDADEVFAMLETPHALYLFSMAKDNPEHVDEFALYGESATLAMLALVKLLNKGRLLLKTRQMVPSEHRHLWDQSIPQGGPADVPAALREGGVA